MNDLIRSKVRWLSFVRRLLARIELRAVHESASVVNLAFGPDLGRLRVLLLRGLKNLVLHATWQADDTRLLCIFLQELLSFGSCADIRGRLAPRLGCACSLNLGQNVCVRPAFGALGSRGRAALGRHAAERILSGSPFA